MKSTFRISAVLSAAGLFGSLLSMLAQLCIARVFGSGVQTDAYFAGLSLPLLVGGLLSGGVSYHVIPLLFHVDISKVKLVDYQNALLIVSMAGALFVVICGIVASTWAVEHYGGWRSFQPFQIKGIAVTGWVGAGAALLTAVLGAISQSQREFLRPAFLGYISSLMVIFTCLILSGAHETAIAAAAAAAVGQIIALIVLSGKMGVLRRLQRPTAQAFRAVLMDIRLAPLVLLSMTVFCAFGTIDAYFGAKLGDGTISSLAFAQRILIALAGIVINGAGVVVLPNFSELAAQNDFETLGKQVRTALRFIALLVAPVSAILGTLSVPTITLIFLGGKFAQADVNRLAALIPYMAVGVIPMSCCTILFRVFYATKKAVNAAIIGLCGALLYACCCFAISMKGLGIEAFGIAYAITWIVVCATSLWRIQATTGMTLLSTQSAGWIAKLGLCLLGMVLCTDLTCRLFDLGMAPRGGWGLTMIMCASIIGIGVFVGIGFLTRLAGLERILSMGLGLFRSGEGHVGIK